METFNEELACSNPSTGNITSNMIRECKSAALQAIFLSSLPELLSWPLAKFSAIKQRPSFLLQWIVTSDHSVSQANIVPSLQGWQRGLVSKINSQIWAGASGSRVTWSDRKWDWPSAEWSVDLKPAEGQDQMLGWKAKCELQTREERWSLGRSAQGGKSVQGAPPRSGSYRMPWDLGIPCCAWDIWMVF